MVCGLRWNSFMSVYSKAMLDRQVIVKSVVAGCVLFGAANAAASIRNAFPLPDLGPYETEYILADRVLVSTLHRFTVAHADEEGYAELVETINKFMCVVAESERAMTGVGFQFRATRLADDAVRIATRLRTGVDVDVEDIEGILGDHLHNMMVL